MLIDFASGLDSTVISYWKGNKLMNYPKVYTRTSGTTKAYFKGADHASKGGKRSDNPYTHRAYIDHWFDGFDDEKENMTPREFEADEENY